MPTGVESYLTTSVTTAGSVGLVTATSLGLQEAADVLGVHYQTAYKWVRSGALPAVRVGGSYRLSADDVHRFAVDRERPAPPPKRRPRRGFARLATRFHDHLLAGEERAARRDVADLLADGLDLTEVAEHVIAPALRAIGEDWVTGHTGISEEHRASAIVERILGEHAPNPRGRRRGRAVVTALSGDHHALATALAAVALRDDNWHVEHLGADVPPDEVVRFADEIGADLVVISVTAPEAMAPADQLAARLEKAGHRALVGHPGASLADLQRSARGD